MRPIFVLVIAALALVLANPVHAQRGVRNSVRGEAMLISKDTAADTIRIGYEVFKVTPETLIRDKEGNLISLADVEVPETGNKTGDWAVLGGKFLAKRIGDDNVLIWLTLIEPPR